MFTIWKISESREKLEGTSILEGFAFNVKTFYLSNFYLSKLFTYLESVQNFERKKKY